ncbi:hypothetical protein DL96DRAFT_1810955 [Flagelloscypha sp. PMI_526]|nr:hypothetical protein DL96DRAFT_1810955 [Flagelloscypha sp. PMI_526]
MSIPHIGTMDNPGSSSSSMKKDDSDGDLPDTTRKRRKRQTLSCSECKRRKIKCDRVQPCSPCTKRGEAHLCVWIGGGEANEKYVTRSDFDALTERVKRLERVIETLTSGAGPPPGHLSGYPQAHGPPMNPYPPLSGYHPHPAHIPIPSHPIAGPSTVHHRPQGPAQLPQHSTPPSMPQGSGSGSHVNSMKRVRSQAEDVNDERAKRPRHSLPQPRSPGHHHSLPSLGVPPHASPPLTMASPSTVRLEPRPMRHHETLPPLVDPPARTSSRLALPPIVPVPTSTSAEVLISPTRERGPSISSERPRHERTSSPRHERTSSPRHERTSSPRHERTSSPRRVPKNFQAQTVSWGTTCLRLFRIFMIQNSF